MVPCHLGSVSLSTFYHKTIDREKKKILFGFFFQLPLRPPGSDWISRSRWATGLGTLLIKKKSTCKVMTENVHINEGLPHWWFSCKCGTVESGIFSPFLIFRAVLNTFALLLLHFTVLNLVLNIAITYSPLSIKQACSLSPSPFALSVLGLYCSTVEPPYSKAYCTSRNQYYSRTFIYIAMSTETRNRLLYQVTWKLC